MPSQFTLGGMTLIDESSEFGARAAAHLREDPIVWLTTVSGTGAPLPTPVWFHWDGQDSVRVYSLPSARRVAHIAGDEHVSLNFAGDGQGGDIVVFSGRARVDPDAEAADRAEPYLAKYAAGLERLGLTPAEFAQRYATALHIELTRLRGH
jgi:PPOX class probable F420-dependent enzyme